MRRLALTFAAGLVISMLAANAAWAGGGNSSVDQYTEHVPSAGGGGGGNPGGSGSGSIPQSTQQALENQGPAGQAAANLAESSAPAHKDSKAGNHGNGKSAKVHAVGASGPGDTGGGSAGDAIGQAVKGDASGGLGIALPIILAAALLGAIAILVVRRRGSGGGDPQAS